MAYQTEVTITAGVPTAGSGEVYTINKVAKLEDDASANLDGGIPAMAVRKLTPANTSGADGDYEFLQMSAGQLHVNAGHHQPGTNGFLATPFALIANSETGSDTLGSGAAMTGATARSQADTLGAKKAEIYLIVGDAGCTPTAGGNIAGWFLKSTDGGTAYENLRSTPSATVPALPRPPDFIIPIYEGGTAQTAADIKFASGLVNLPHGTFKTVIQNNAGVALGNTTTTHLAIMCAPVA